VNRSYQRVIGCYCVNAEVLGALRVLTRRIGLELIVPQYPALARAPAPSEQGTMQDEKGAGPFSTGWEHPVESDPPSQEQGSLSGSPDRVLPLLGAFPSMEGTLGAAYRFPHRGGGREAVLQAERPAQAGREASVGSKTARKRPEALDSPAGAPTSSRQKVLERRGLG
jgi:hypothetical protein